MKFILESVTINKSLNAKLFNDSLKLKDEILDKLTTIADKFVTDVKEAGIPIKVIDYWLVGSNAAYNYTDQSDIDIHIVADTSSVSKDPSVLKLLYDYFKSHFNDRYNIKVKGHEVELYIEDVNSLTVTNGIYSLFNDDWIKVPQKVRVENIDVESTELYQLMLKRFNSDSDVQQLIDDLYILRKTSLANEGEFGVGNLVFKAFRNNGYLKILKDKVTADETKQLSLEKLEESLLDEATTPQYREILFELICALTENTDLKNLIRSGNKLHIHHVDGKYETYKTRNNTERIRAVNNTPDNIMIMSAEAHRAISRFKDTAPSLIKQYIDNLVRDKKAFYLKDCLPSNIFSIINQCVDDDVAISDASDR